jgi:hypothetical protein
MTPYTWQKNKTKKDPKTYKISLKKLKEGPTHKNRQKKNNQI